MPLGLCFRVRRMQVYHTFLKERGGSNEVVLCLDARKSTPGKTLEVRSRQWGRGRRILCIFPLSSKAPEGSR
jgi:hypothetical protein